MKKKLFLILSVVVIAIFVAGCSSKEADEIVDLHNDFNENVGVPMEKLGEEFDEKGQQMESGEIAPDEFLTFFEDEVQPSLDEMRKYMDEYDEPSTDDAKNYHSKLTSALSLVIDGVEMSGELIGSLIDDSKSEEAFYEMSEDLDKIGVEIDKKTEEIEELQDKYEEEYDIEIEDMDLE